MMVKLIRYWCKVVIILLIFYADRGSLFAQNSHHLIVHYLDTTETEGYQKPTIQTNFTSKSECDEYIVRLTSMLYSKGFIAASVDSIFTETNKTSIFLFLGKKYLYLQLTVPPGDIEFVDAVERRSNNKSNLKFSFSAYATFREKLLDYFEETGFPFSSIALDSLTISDSVVYASLLINKGSPYRFDSVRIYGSAKIAGNFLHRYLNIERGSAFSKKKLDKINQRILELPYLQQSRPWDITMLNTGSIINLYLQPRRSNQVNVLAGLLPSNQQIGGKLLFTIDANLRLQNAFGGGETVGLLWQQIQPKSPRLNLQFNQPYLFNSPFGVDFMFDLFKRDSAFLNINSQLGLLYMLSPAQTGKLIIQNRTTNILDVDTNMVKATKKLPDVADVSAVNLGLEYEYSNTDYRLNPRKGNEFFISIFAGKKTIRKNNAISQLKDTLYNYNNLYDSLQLKTYQVRFKCKGAHYFKTGNQTVLKTALEAGLYQSPLNFRNELFQIGGYKTLRGFDEESIFADRYAIFTCEYRYLLDLNSNIFAFSDVGWAQNNLIKQSNSYLGAGIGMSFQTKAGILSLSYAAGKRNDLSFDIKQSKIHFGFVSIF